MVCFNFRLLNCLDGDDFQPDKRFVDVLKLAAEKRKQAKEQKLTCKECGYVAKTAYFLKRHVATNHTDQKDMPYKCTVCGKEFAVKCRMREHI